MPNPFASRSDYSGNPPWKVFTNNPVAWSAMLTAIRKAQKTIDLEQFIFVHDAIGSEFIDTLKERAKAGVRIRILLDAAGSFSLFGSSIVSELSESNIQISFFNRLIFKALRNQEWWYFRNHRRSLIIDSGTEFGIAFTGSFCIWEKVRTWRDTTVLITGDILEEITRAFSIMWDRSHDIKLDWGRDKSSATEGINYIAQSPHRHRHYIYTRIVEAIRNARSYVYITTPYFVPDHRLLRVIRLAARRGVDVRILMPEHSDHPIVDRAGRSHFHNLLKYGISIYLYTPSMIHAKGCIIDGEWATIGTLNLDHVSLFYNFEGNLVITNTDCIAEIKKQFLSDLTKTRKIDPKEWSERPLRHKLAEKIVFPYENSCKYLPFS